jgi:hypothetical protein
MAGEGQAVAGVHLGGIRRTVLAEPVSRPPRRSSSTPVAERDRLGPVGCLDLGAQVQAPSAAQLATLWPAQPAGPGAELSLADFGDAEVAQAEAAIEGRPSAAGPDAVPPVEAIAIPPVEAPDITVPEITADAEQAERP